MILNDRASQYVGQDVQSWRGLLALPDSAGIVRSSIGRNAWLPVASTRVSAQTLIQST